MMNNITTLYSYIISNVASITCGFSDREEERYYTAFGADGASLEEMRAAARKMMLEPVDRGGFATNVDIYRVDGGVYLASGPSWTMVSEGPSCQQGLQNIHYHNKCRAQHCRLNRHTEGCSR